MKKEEKSIEINKENYKGYAELYKAINNRSNQESKCLKEFIIQEVVFSSLCMVVMIGCMTFTLSSFLFLGGCMAIICGKNLITMHQLKQEKRQDVKKEYPYVDININKKILQKSLEKVGIIRCLRLSNTNVTIWKLEEYENYLKAEEVKENYLEETKYDKYVVNPRIEEQELEKVKVKVKLLTR